MTKTVTEERMAIVFILTRAGGTGPVEVACRADYTVKSDDLEVNRETWPALTTAQISTVKTFAASILSDIRQMEGV